MCRVMSDDAAAVVLDLVGVGDEGHRLEELVEGVVVGGRPHELSDVLQPAGRLQGVLRLELGHVSGAWRPPRR